MFDVGAVRIECDIWSGVLAKGGSSPVLSSDDGVQYQVTVDADGLVTLLAGRFTGAAKFLYAKPQADVSARRVQTAQQASVQAGGGAVYASSSRGGKQPLAPASLNEDAYSFQPRKPTAIVYAAQDDAQAGESFGIRVTEGS